MTHGKAAVRWAVSLTLFFCSTSLWAQEARSFEQLKLLVKPGDRVFVTDSTGREVTGKVEALSSTSLRLMTKDATRDLTESDVFKMRQWRHDSLKNGAIIGASAGLGLSLIGVAAYCGGNGCGGEAVAAIVLYTGMGAAIGVGLDALIPAKQIVFIGGTRTSLSRLKVKPILGNSRKGIGVSMSF